MARRRKSLGDVVLDHDPTWGPYMYDCPSIWIAVTSKVVPVQYGKPIPKNTPMTGFDAATKQQAQRMIDDAVADGHWPAKTLRPKRVLDCRIRARRIITPAR